MIPLNCTRRYRGSERVILITYLPLNVHFSSDIDGGGGSREINNKPRKISSTRASQEVIFQINVVFPHRCPHGKREISVRTSEQRPDENSPRRNDVSVTEHARTRTFSCIKTRSRQPRTIGRVEAPLRESLPFPRPSFPSGSCYSRATENSVALTESFFFPVAHVHTETHRVARYCFLRTEAHEASKQLLFRVN